MMMRWARPSSSAIPSRSKRRRKQTSFLTMSPALQRVGAVVTDCDHHSSTVQTNRSARYQRCSDAHSAALARTSLHPSSRIALVLGCQPPTAGRPDACITKPWHLGYKMGAVEESGGNAATSSLRPLRKHLLRDGMGVTQ